MYHISKYTVLKFVAAVVLVRWNREAEFHPVFK